MSKTLREFSPKTQAKYHGLTNAVIDEMLLHQNSGHTQRWTKKELAHLANVVNEREEFFLSLRGKKRFPRRFKPTAALMKKFVSASQSNGSNSVLDLDYAGSEFGECGYVVRIGESVPYGCMKHANVIPAGFAKRNFELVFDLGDKLKSVEVAARELSAIPDINPYLTVLLAMYHLKSGAHDFDKPTTESMRETLRLLEKELVDYRESGYQDLLDGLMLAPPHPDTTTPNATSEASEDASPR